MSDRPKRKVEFIESYWTGGELGSDYQWNDNHGEIVRCKDCINCVKEPNGELYCDILAVGYEPLGSKKVNGDWFCADGERKQNDRAW